MTVLATIHTIPPSMTALGALAAIARGPAEPLGRELRQIKSEQEAALRCVARIQAEAEAEMESLTGTQPTRGTTRNGR